MNCISCGSGSGEDILCPNCSSIEKSMPAYNLLGNSLFTDVRQFGTVAIGLGPSWIDYPVSGALPSLTHELEGMLDRLAAGREPQTIAARFEMLLVNAGMPEIMESGNLVMTRECAVASNLMMRLDRELRDAGTLIPPRTENFLGNMAWLRSPALSGTRAEAPKTKDAARGRDGEIILGYYTRAIKTEPENHAAMMNKATLLHVISRHPEAIEACRAILEKKPEEAAAWKLMGEANLALTNYEEAIRCFDASLKLNRKDNLAWMMKGDALMRLNRFPEALTCYERSLQLEPSNPVALDGRGDALTRLGSIDKAVESYDMAKGLLPKPVYIPRKSIMAKAAAPPATAPEAVRPEFMPTTPAREETVSEIQVQEIIEKPEPAAHVEMPAKSEIESVPELVAAREEHPIEKLSKEPFELKMEEELEAVLDISESDDEITDEIIIEEEEPLPEPVEEEPEPIPEPPIIEKKPRSLAEMFMGGLNIEPETEEVEEPTEEEWPSLPDEIDLPDSGNEDDEPVLGPLMGIPNGKAKEPEFDLAPEEKDALEDIEEIETRLMLDAALEPGLSPSDAIRNLIENNDYAEALRRSDAILAREPDDAKILALKGGILTQMDRTDDALQILDRAVKSDPKNVLAWIKRGDLFCEMDDYKKAEESYDSALKLETDNLEAWLSKGECQLATENYDQAIVSFNEVIEMDRENVDAWLGIGDTFLGLDREDDAYKCYDKVTALDPTSPEGWTRLGDVLILKGRWGGAMQMYERAIKCDPDEPEAYLNKAKIMMNRGMLDEADAIYSKLLERAPTDPDAQTGRVEIMIRKGKWGAAVQSLNSIMRQYPDNARVWALQGDAYREQGDVARAKPPYEKALELDSNDFTALSGKGRLMLDNGGYNEAIDYFRKAIDEDSEDPYVWRFLGDAQREVGKEKEALKSYEMATELGDNIPENWLAYGMALHEASRYPEAIEAFDRVTKLKPGHPEAVKWREQSTKRLLKGVK